MRRLIVPVLMISLLLTGCDSGAVQRKLKEQREKFAAAENISFVAELTANPGKEVFQCTVACAAAGGELTVELLSPESVAGIRARIADGQTTLEYENISLGVGTAGQDGITPVSAAPLLISALRSGFLQRCWIERDADGELLAEEVYITDAAELTVWYRSEELTPVRCEFVQEDKVILRCDIREFRYN